MRVGVIRGDLGGPIFLADVEPVSRRNVPVDPPGQERYIGRPTVAEVEAVLADSTVGAGAVLEGSDIAGSFPLTITLGVDDDLMLKTSSSASFSTYTIAAGAYTTLPLLLAAINTALAGSGITARAGTGSGSRVALESDTKGVDSYIENDTVAHGSTANTGLGLADGAVRDMPTAATFITDCLPVGGPLDVSSTTVNAVGATTNANALGLIPSARGTVTALADALAPRLADTAAAIDSFLVGYLSEYRNASFNPDPRRVPALSSGAAVEVVADDGSTPYAGTLPTITTSTLGSPTAGDVTIAGTGLGGEAPETKVKFTGDVVKLLDQRLIEANGGSVSSTAIVIPAALIPGAATTTTSVQVQVRQRLSAVDALV
jgi:hypothetical protein